MFERFSTEARAAVVEAQTVAREAGSAAIDTRHVLAALAGSPGPAADGLRGAGLDPAAVSRTVRDEVRAGDLDAEALASLGIDLESVRRETDATFGRGALARAGRRPRKGHVPFTPDAKKALELALREALRLGDKGIDGSHLLLGILRADCPGGRSLERALHGAGTDVAALRSAAEQRRRAA
jgi:ATP-dependent Clp protease ATP-binding subunit ClpA